MGKTKKCQGKDIMERINYLYQIANLITDQNGYTKNNSSSNLYTNLMIQVAHKAVQRLDINLKRTICKVCRTLLLSGVTCRVRIKKKKLIWTCFKCDTSKIFNVKDRNYTPWTLKDESVVEILNYKNNK